MLIKKGFPSFPHWWNKHLLLTIWTTVLTEMTENCSEPGCDVWHWFTLVRIEHLAVRSSLCVILMDNMRMGVECVCWQYTTEVSDSVCLYLLLHSEGRRWRQKGSEGLTQWGSNHRQWGWDPGLCHPSLALLSHSAGPQSPSPRAAASQAAQQHTGSFLHTPSVRTDSRSYFIPAVSSSMSVSATIIYSGRHRHRYSSLTNM